MKIGYALYSAREKYRDKEGLFRVLEEVAEMGYDAVEFYGYTNATAQELSEKLKFCGLTGLSTHVSLERWISHAEEEIDFAVQAGIPYIVFPWLPEEMRVKEIYSQLEKGLPLLAYRCQKQRICLQYHNHNWEFERGKGRYVMDDLLSGDNNFLYEMDTFWAHYAGVDPISYLKEMNERIRMFHIKDYIDLGEEPHFCAIGTGRMNNEAILKSAAELGKEWVIVELDNSPIDPLESARISIRNVKRMMSDKGSLFSE